MPELPEVQTIVDGLIPLITGKAILEIEVIKQKSFSNETATSIINNTINSIERIGKYIIFHLSNGDLVIHLRMTGQFFYYEDAVSYQPSPHTRLIFTLSKGLLVFRDVRRFATVQLATSFELVLPKLGIDPFSPAFSLAYFKNELQASSLQVKAYLLKQDKIAGLGNIYADEALYLARVHPGSICNRLSEKASEELFVAITTVLIKGLKSKGTSLGSGIGNYKHINGEGENQQALSVYGKVNQACPVCLRPFIKIKAAGRGTTLCAHCQVIY